MYLRILKNSELQKKFSRSKYSPYRLLSTFAQFIFYAVHPTVSPSVILKILSTYRSRRTNIEIVDQKMTG